MATKTMYRVLNMDSQMIEVKEYQYYSNIIVLDEIEVVYDDTITSDLREKLIEGLESKVQKANADIFTWKKMISDLKLIEHKPDWEDIGNGSN